MQTQIKDLEEKIIVPIPQTKYSGGFDKAVNIAEYYGFNLLEPMALKKADAVIIGGNKYPNKKIASLRNYIEKGIDSWATPVMVAHTYKAPRKRSGQFRLEIFESNDSSAEATMIHVANTILKEYGHKDLLVKINCTGGIDSIDNFMRELILYYRENINGLDARCRHSLSKDILAVLRCNNKKCREIRENAPKPINFLTSKSRAYFSEVLEYLEVLGVNYRLSHELIHNVHYAHGTVFEITNGKDKSPILARGERYNNLSKRAGLKHKVSAFGVVIKPKKVSVKEKFYPAVKERDVPKIFLVQLGFGSRTKMLNLLEDLRREKISTCAKLNCHGLTEQIEYARSCGIQTLAIIGQKEIVDDTVIIRNNDTLAQQTIPMARLIPFLKKL